MDPDEVEAWLATLPPEEQQQALYELGLDQANQMPPGFQGAYQPELEPGQYSMLSMQRLPMDIEYGDVQPFGLDEFAQAQNAIQDTAMMALDPALRMQAGPGAFSAGAFTPTTMPMGEPLDLAGARYVDMLASSGPGYESYLAQKVKPIAMGGAGMSPGQAVASMWADIKQPAPGQEALAEQLKASLPPVSTDPNNPRSGLPSVVNEQNAFDFTTPQGQAASTNVDAVTAKAQELFDRIASDPVPGYTDPATGLQYAGSYEQPTGPMEKFDEYGLPYPTETYLDEKWLPQLDPQLQAEQQANTDIAQQQLDLAKQIRDQTRGNMGQLQQGWDESNLTRGGPAPFDVAAAKVGGIKPSLDTFLATERARVGLPPVNKDAGYSMAGLGNQTDAERGLQEQSAGAARDAYDKAYTDWEEDEKRRRNPFDFSGAGGRSQTKGTQNPFAISSGGKVIDTYNFGGSAEEQTGMGNLANIWAGLQGYDNPQVGSYGSPSFYRPSAGSALDQYQNARSNLWDQQQVTTPDEMDRAYAQGAGYAMQKQGRTPLQDVLMQGAMARLALMPNAGYG